MLYALLFWSIYPLLFFLSFFRKQNKTKNLIIQTTKIGDYVNTTIMFEPLKSTDIIIDNINKPFALHEPILNNIYTIDTLKKSKLKTIFTIFFNNYENVYVVMPNSFNTFLASISFAKNKNIIHTYSTKWYVKLLSFHFNRIIHTKENLTLNSYLKMIDHTYSYKAYKKRLPIVQNNTSFNKGFNIGISLSAGNQMKTIEDDTWNKIFKIISNFQSTIYFFGLDCEKEVLNKFIPILKELKINFKSHLGLTPLQELPFEISNMNLYISSDTGNSYIADTFNIPIINFAGPCYMKEQRPVGENVLIVESNAPCVPFSFIFNAPYKSQCENLYSITTQQEESIQSFIAQVFDKFVQSH